MAQPVWNTPAGSIGTYPATLIMATQLSASPVSPATIITYTLLSGTLPSGTTITSSGLISGTPTLVTIDTTTTFTIRATDNLSNIRDRTFSMTVSGTAIPEFSTPAGSILNTLDSVWIELPIEYSNPESTNQVVVELQEGILPPGLEINPAGVIRGYATPPTVTVTLTEVDTNATLTDGTSYLITCTSTTQFTVGRPVIFTSTVFGGIEEGETYYIRSINSTTTFTIAATQNGDVFSLTSASGSMTVTLPAISFGQPTIRTYSFILRLSSNLGGDTVTYSITVVNQNTPVSQGGPGYTINSRIPTILNTRPRTFIITDNDPYSGYYILPPVSPTVNAFIGTIRSGEYFTFKVIGYDFDGSSLTYEYIDLPADLTGDTETGWITGTPTLNSIGLSTFNFSVNVYKTDNTSIGTPNFNFSYNLSNEITDTIIWSTPSDLGTIFNSTISTLNVIAIADTELSYRITSGALPPNLLLLDNGEITGIVANQPTDTLLEQNAETVFTVNIQAYSALYPVVQATKTFTITVIQEYTQPTDTLYIKAAPSINDRNILNTLLSSETLIPEAMVYRPNDIYFGKSTSIIYEHAYGIYSSEIDEYLAAVTQNHYWRNITLGEIKTAVAKNSAGEIIYEVVYSEVIDNLVNPLGVSIQQEIYWPRPIDLNLGPWYTSITDIFTSYDTVLGQDYYTSLTPGYAQTLYPNSLFNMRNRVGQVVGQEFDSRLLPLWMTSQQSNGGTLGYTQAWVICYTKPGIIVDGELLTYAEFKATGLTKTRTEGGVIVTDYFSSAETIKNNINNNWSYTLNQINFRIDRFSVDKSETYNYDKRLNPPAWTGLPSATPVPDPLDSKDFYVLFPRQTILPDESQY
jgi:hypothetical protein